MVGFFEREYLSFKKNHIKNLIGLAKIDGFAHDAELRMIHKIGKHYGLKVKQIQALVDSKEKPEIIIPKNFDDKLNVLHDLMLVLYADGKVDTAEVAFCEDVVKQFGMDRKVLTWLLTDVFQKGIAPTPEMWVEAKQQWTPASASAKRTAKA